MDKMHRYLRVCGIPVLLFYVISLTVLTQSGFTVIEILRDTPQTTGQSSFLGFLSNIGVWFWVSAAAISLARAFSFEPDGDDAIRRLLILVGGLTDVCVHYTFVDAHQGDYFCRVIEDCVAGSSREAHDASLKAVEYLQHGAVRSLEDIFLSISVNRYFYGR